GDLAVRGDLASTGVDAYVGLLARGPGGGRARLSTTMRTRTPNQAVTSSTAGSARLTGPLYAPGTPTVSLFDGPTATLHHPGEPADGMAFEAAETARRITAGDLESPLMTWQDTVSVMETMDAVRAELGVVYPGEVLR